MMSSNGNISRVTGLCDLWPVDSPQKTSAAELWYLLRSAPKQMVEQTIETPVIWGVIALIMTPK